MAQLVTSSLSEVALHVKRIQCHKPEIVLLLQLEMARQKIPGGAQGKAAKALTEIGQPAIDWVALAQGMGVQHAVKAATAEELADAFKTALQRSGPSVIECIL